VTCHLRIARSPGDIHAVRIAAGEADLVLGCDMVVVNDYWALSKIRAARSRVVLNTYEAMPGTFTTRPDMEFPAQQILAAVKTALDGEEPELVDATELATKLLGDSIASNLFMLGYAWQKGWVPLTHESLMRAIELNAAAVEMNKTAFNWGRLAAHDIARVREAALGKAPATADAIPALVLDDSRLSATLDDIIARRGAFLTDYQDAAYAGKYRALVDKVRAAEKSNVPGSTQLSEAVARYAFKLMAYKDEYEVARLYTSGDFEKRVRDTFDGDYRIHFNLAPPLFARRDSEGHLRKSEYGAWVFSVFKLLAKMKGLRGGAFDIFGYTAERKMERALIDEYFTTVDMLLSGLNRDNHAAAVEIASIPEHIRGYGHIKEAHLADARKRQDELMVAWRNPGVARAAA
jgi:indolepyruvate ferredoxin oxidoreductase